MVNPFLYLRRFDHIVFDEFHTIDDRSFGLACLFSHCWPSRNGRERCRCCPQRQST